jgi:uncharacterized protein YbcV (DUF1398 family)
MTSSVRSIVEACAHDSHAGTRNFGEIVMALMGAGVESYFADFRSATTTYYLPSGEAIATPLPMPELQAADTFSAEAMHAAVRGAQSGQVKYPEFVRLSLAAGCVGYMVWIAGRHVSYFGRRGETHIEHFPSGK